MDVYLHVFHMQLRKVKTENDLEGLSEDVLDLMEESGCDRQLRASINL